MLISDSIRKSIRWLMYDNMLNAKLFHSFFLNELWRFSSFKQKECFIFDEDGVKLLYFLMALKQWRVPHLFYL